MCEVSNDGKIWKLGERRLVAILPKNFSNRYIVWSDDIGKDLNGKDLWSSWTYARLITCIHPKIEGDIYTWEKEVEE